MSLKQYLIKIKSFLIINQTWNYVLFGIFIFMILIGNYQYTNIKYLMKNDDNKIEIINTKKIKFLDFKKEEPVKNTGNIKIMASKNGSRYYFANCSGINRIKKENLIYFNTEKQAINSGLSKSKTCP